jgi:hypothetical protein
MPSCRPEDGSKSTEKVGETWVCGQDTGDRCERAEMGTVFFAATMVAPRGGVTASKRLCAAAAAAAPSRV